MFLCLKCTTARIPTLRGEKERQLEREREREREKQVQEPNKQVKLSPLLFE